MSIKDEQFSNELDEITKNDDLSINQKRVAAGKLLRETVKRLKGEGKSETEIADLTGIRVHRLRELNVQMRRREIQRRTEAIQQLKNEGKSNAEIAELLDIPVQQAWFDRDDIALVIKNHDLSETAEFKVEGPWGHRGVEGLKTPVYIFVPGGEKKEVGEATVTTSNGMKFEIELYEEVDQAAFEIPMRFVVRKKEEL